MNNRLKIILNLDNICIFIKKWIIPEKVLLSIDDNNNYFIIILDKGNFLNQVKLNKNTYLPIITKLNILNMLFKVYKEEYLIIKELIPLISKYKIKYDSFKYVNEYREKPKEIPYYLNYTLLVESSIKNCKENIIRYEDMYMKYYYIPINGNFFISYGEFMMNSLIADT